MTSPGSALAALRRQATRTCPVCGKTFTARATAIYCSPVCRRKAWIAAQAPKNK